MAKILINDELELEGSATITQRLDGNEHIIEGIITLKKYIPVIRSVATFKFICNNIFILEESFGTDDDLFGYRFVAEDLTIMNEGEVYHVK